MDLRSLLGLPPAQPNPMQSLLGNFYNPQDAQKQMINQALMGAGIGLLSLEPGPYKRGILGELGAGMKGAIQGAQQGKEDYTNNAFNLYAFDQKKQENDRQLADRQRAENERMTQKKALYDYADTLNDPAQSSFLKAFPEIGARQAAQNLFPDPNADLERRYKEAQIQSIQNGGRDAQGVYGNLTPYRKPDGSIGYAALTKDGRSVDVPAPNGAYIPPYDLNYQKSSGTAAGKQVGGAQGALPAATLDAQTTIAKVDSLLNNPNLESAIGWKSYIPDAMSSNAVIDIRGRVKELMGQSFLSAYATLKGGGQITEVEGAKAQQAIQRMETAIQSSDPQVFRSALVDFKSAVETGLKKLQAQAGQSGMSPGGAGDSSLSPNGVTSGGVPWSVE